MEEAEYSRGLRDAPCVHFPVPSLIHPPTGCSQVLALVLMLSQQLRNSLIAPEPNLRRRSVLGIIPGFPCVVPISAQEGVWGGSIGGQVELITANCSCFMQTFYPLPLFEARGRVLVCVTYPVPSRSLGGLEDSFQMLTVAVSPCETHFIAVLPASPEDGRPR